MDVIRTLFKSTPTGPCCDKPNIIDMEMRVCTNCGTSHGPVFVTRFNHNCRPLYIYSRITRFMTVLFKYKIDDRNIEELFRLVEDAWKTMKFKRKYFLSLVFLVFNLGQLLGYDLRSVHGNSIKDPNRLEKQRKILRKLLGAINPQLEVLYDSGLFSVHLQVIGLLGNHDRATTNNSLLNGGTL